MKQIYPDLWQTRLLIPFGQVHTHAYFLQTGQGNILLYNTSHDEDLQHMTELGGIRYQLLSHRDEKGDSLQVIKERFGSELGCHQFEETAIAEFCNVDITFSKPVAQLAGIYVIHTPGHSDGSISFLYHSTHRGRYLFTGDALFRTNGDWQTLIVRSAGGNLTDLINSLSTYRSLNPDAVIWSASGGGDPAFYEPTVDEWENIIDRKIQKLKQTI